MRDFWSNMGFDDFWWLLIYYHLRTSCSIIFCSESVNKKFQVFSFDLTIQTFEAGYYYYCCVAFLASVLLAYYYFLCFACPLVLPLYCLPAIITSLLLAYSHCLCMAWSDKIKKNCVLPLVNWFRIREECEEQQGRKGWGSCVHVHASGL